MQIPINILRNLTKLMLLILVLSAIPTSVSCNTGKCTEENWNYYTGEFDYIKVNPTKYTKDKISYDDGQLNINPDVIDRLTTEVETCLNKNFPNGLPTEVMYRAICNTTIIPKKIDRSSFVVKIADNYVLSCDKSQQMLPNPVRAGGSGCVQKGLNPSETCPCRWRSGIQCPNKLITTPSMYIYKDVLIRFVTTCKDPWGNELMAQCAAPSTNPLDDNKL